MTLLKLIRSGTLNTREEKADYLVADVEYIVNVCQSIGYDDNDIGTLAADAGEKIKNREELNEEESRLVGAIFVGDAEWQNPWTTWIDNDYFRKVALLSDGWAHHKWMSIAEEFYDVSKLEVPYYSRPADYRYEDKTALEMTDSSEEALMIKTGILHTEWFTYVCDQIGIEYDKELAEKSKEEIAEFYTSQRSEISNDTKQFQKALFENDIEWFKFINNELGVSSYFIERAWKTFDKHIENDFE